LAIEENRFLLPENGVAAEHAVPADRFAREIGAFLTCAPAARLRQLNGNPFDA
jgi:hypothetical protein